MLPIVMVKLTLKKRKDKLNKKRYRANGSRERKRTISTAPNMSSLRSLSRPYASTPTLLYRSSSLTQNSSIPLCYDQTDSDRIRLNTTVTTKRLMFDSPDITLKSEISLPDTIRKRMIRTRTGHHDHESQRAKLPAVNVGASKVFSIDFKKKLHDKDEDETSYDGPVFNGASSPVLQPHRFTPFAS